MICLRCKRYNPDDKETCEWCGADLTKPANRGTVQDLQPQGEAKTGTGILLGLLLGVIGLIIGVCLYPEGSLERKTFIDGWIKAFILGIVLSVIVFGITYCGALSLLNSYY